ncbi:MAG TPA: hypothetical protein DEV81_13445 [Cyanobacteria bacterium UBA11049]|nr:hypothetical protein [Cyanobacteria bacterium UBA11049]
MEGKGTKVWSLSQDAHEYERIKNLLSGRLANSFTPEQINAHTLKESLEHLQVKANLEVIHDGSDIRKPYSKALPHLTSVKALNGDWVHGYNTFNSIVISEVDQQIHLLQCTPYSYSDPHYNQAIGAGFTEKEIIENQLQATDQALKERFPGVTLWHLLDRKHDDESTFAFIDGLKSHFVIRLKANRNSNETKVDENGKTVFIKLNHARLTHTLTQPLERFVWKNKVYQQASLTTAYGTLSLSENTYQVCRIEVKDRQGNPIFKEPMLLLTNAPIENLQQAFQLYQRYLKRSKIEGVFKFLKDYLGWEQFQIRDFLAIQNIIVLCFFVAEYFYENQLQLTQAPQVAIICQLAKSKGTISKHFYQKGLAILANYLLFQQYINEQNLSQQQVNQLLSILN